MSDVVSKFPTLLDQLKSHLQPGPERGGFILPDGTILEVANHCEEPEEGFDAFDLSAADEAIATWHTHPGASANLSAEDTKTFLEWPDLEHFIVGEDGVRAYRVKGLGVVNA